MGKFGDVEKQKLNVTITARIKVALTLLFQMFATSRANTGRKIQNFIPHLKRTDRDCGSLPFFSKDYHSQKTNKEHVLLCMISRVIQEYWRFVSPTAEMSNEDAKAFLDHVDLLEEISKANFQTFQVSGRFPKFTLMSKAKLDAIELADVQQEKAEANVLEEREQEHEDRRKAALAAVDATWEEEQQRVKDSDDAKNAMDQDGGATTQEQSAGVQASASPMIPSAPAASSSKATQPDADDLSVEAADRCGGDCDKCTDQVCTEQKNEGECSLAEEPDAVEDDIAAGMADEAKEADAEREDNIGGAVVGGVAEPPCTEGENGEPCCLDCEMEDQRKTEEADGNEETDLDSDAAEEEKYPEPPAPPMPDEEKDSQAAVDHETGDDQADA
jgi:hypothetical protein